MEKICLALLSSSLLRNPRSSAAVVDTTGNFDVLRLYSFILARLQDDSELLDAMKRAMGAESVSAEDVAARSLDRVNIMRAFDLVGVMEAVGEVRDELQGQHHEEKADNPKKSSQEGQREDLLSEETPHEEIPELEKELPKRTFVADSDDEGEEMLFNDEPAVSIPTNHPPVEVLPTEAQDEILFVDGSADQRDSTSHPPPVAINLQIQPAEPEQSRSIPDSAPTKPTFLLIDNLAHVISPLLQKNHAQAQALTSSFMLTLSHLTRNYNLQTLLCNPSVPPRPPTKKANPNEETRRQPPPPPSIFASNKSVPALVGILSPYLDLSLLVERMPRRKMDARAVYTDGEAVQRVKRAVEMVDVIEVMSDRWGGRSGGWGTFVCGERGVKDA
ncbi:hypothetical protein SLS60_007171 [Paraconiothyrium brasiliense]|uniref:DNA recombination and repair protein Rad51-like C-terminal domain-containing protein n=1 Tax=Paraconiothyrium brasiliense TaxID=300254 RepID=A0ABR3R928_9PLEO